MKICSIKKVHSKLLNLKKSFKMANEKTTLTVYADLEMSVLIYSWEIDEELSNTLPIEEAEFDKFDSYDWWEYYASKVERRFGDSWKCFEIISSDKTKGRILERSFCLDYEKPINHFSWIDKVFLFGDTSSEQLHTTFSESIHYQVDLKKLYSNCYYRFGTDEAIVAILRRLGGHELSSCAVLDVVLNPSPSSLLAMKLIDHYKYQISIPTKSKVKRLQQLDSSLRISESIYYSAKHVQRAIDQNELSELSFLSISINNLAVLINGSSTHSLNSIFLDEFKQ
jgi:hypothetical protein